MALKSYTVSSDTIRNVTYPCLLINRNTNMVLLATHELGGVVVQVGSTGYRLGSTYTNINPMLSIRVGFEVLKGKLILEQE
jgi:hypothetical protein